MQPNQQLINPQDRQFQPGTRVRSCRYQGIFEVISYTNRLPGATVFIRDALVTNVVLTYDVPEDTLTAINY